jgi:hypothetical protein
MMDEERQIEKKKRVQLLLSSAIFLYISLSLSLPDA